MPTATMLTVTIVSSVSDSDVFGLDDFSFLDSGPNYSMLVFQGIPIAQRAGIFTATRPENDALNQEWQVTDTSVASWGADVGRLVKITSGPNQGTSFWVVKDLGSGAARVSLPVPSPNSTGFVPPLTGTISAGDTYTTYALPQFNIDRISASARSDFNRIFFRELQIEGPRGAAGLSDVTVAAGESVPVFQRCVIDKAVVGSSTGSSFQFVNFSNCYSKVAVGGSPFANVYFAGVITGVVGLGTNGQTILDGDVYVQGVSLIANRQSYVKIGRAAIFDAPGDALIVQAGSRVYNQNFDYVTHRLWGYGSTGRGVNVEAGGIFSYDTTVPSVTGASDFALSGAAQARAWDDTIPGPTGLRNCTWTNLGAPIASGGFGGQAKNFATDAAIRQNT